MPYIKYKERDFIVLKKELGALVSWLGSVPIEKRKGFVAYIVNYIGKHSFTNNYFGKSTGTDAVRSAYKEMVIDLFEYEVKKKKENGVI